MKCVLDIFNYSMVTNQSADHADIFIDGDIVDEPTREILADWWGDQSSVSFKSFRDQILQSGLKNFTVHVNSGGGHVGDAMAMHDFIKQQRSQGWKINTRGIGIVASAATYVVMAGDEDSETSENSMWLIHNVSGAFRGNVVEFENYTKGLRKFNDTIRDFYAGFTGNSAETIAGWMNKETWMNGKEAFQRGFVKKEPAGNATFKNAIKPEHWPFSNMAVLNSYNSFITPEGENPTVMKKDKLMSVLNSAFEKLGKKNTIKVEDMQNALTQALNDAEDDDDNESPANETVTNAVSEALQGEVFTNAVQAAVNKVLENVPANFTTAITNATKDLVTKATFDELQNSIAEKLGSKPANRKPKTEGPPSNEIPEGVDINVD